MKRPVRTYVIEEDEHLQNLRKIIKRDFFTGKAEKEALNLSLNDYLSTYKSNQNQLFAQMVQNNKQEWKQAHWWIDKQDKLMMLMSSNESKPFHNMLQNDFSRNGIDVSITKQEAKNSFFFNRDGNFGSLQNQQYEFGKKVVYSNCRIQSEGENAENFVMVKRENQTPLRADQYQRQSNREEGEVEDEEQQHPMTWGNIENTPLRIAGPEFKIPETPQRQLILNNLNSKINKGKIQGGKKSQHIKKILGSLTPSARSRHRISSSIRVKDSIKREDDKSLEGLLKIKK